MYSWYNVKNGKYYFGNITATNGSRSKKNKLSIRKLNFTVLYLCHNLNLGKYFHLTA
jgi:hypothetical protein